MWPVVLSEVSCSLGEGAYWHALENKLYWVDIKEHQLYRYDSFQNCLEYWQLPGLVSVVCGMKFGGFIIGFEDKIAEFNIHSAKLKILYHTCSGMRMNDGAVDPAGRFWIGQVDDSRKALGKLYRYDPNGCCQVMEEGLCTSNGLDWDLKRKRFYLIDSRIRTIYVYDYEHETGNICNRRIFLKTKESEGSPDGMVLDSQGYLWVCFWNGSKIVRFSPEGKEDQVINMPVLRPTKCVFWGKDLTDLFITSASSNVNCAEKLGPPDGYSYTLNVGIVGVLPTLFG